MAFVSHFRLETGGTFVTIKSTNKKINMKNLHEEFVKLGKEKRQLTYKLLNLLPEIYKSGIWKKYAKDIYEYAGRYGGIGRSSVEKRLSLEKHLENKPQLKAAIEKVGIHKVALMATIATPTNEKMLADKALNMSKSALQALSKELRNNDGIEPCRAVPTKITIEMDEEMTFLFLKFKKKFKNLNNKEVMKKLLDQAEEKHPKKSLATDSKPAKLITGDEKRYIPAQQKRTIIANGRCQYPNCNKPYQHLHHPKRFSESKSHEGLVALCSDHHEFMHNGLIENEQAPQKYWHINPYKTPDYADTLYREYRRRI